MTSYIYDLHTAALPTVCDFGWFYGSVGAPQRLPEAAFTIGTTSYPPGSTVVAGQSAVLPTASPISVASTATLESSGIITFWASLTQFVSVPYTVASSTTILCTGGTGTYGVGAAVFDQRFYIDPLPLNTSVVFDAVDIDSLGLPKVSTPSGVQIVSYTWDFGNGQQGYGPTASTKYQFDVAPPSIPVTLTVLDSLGRYTTTMHRVRLQPTVIVTGTEYRVGQGRTT